MILTQFLLVAMRTDIYFANPFIYISEKAEVEGSLLNFHSVRPYLLFGLSATAVLNRHRNIIKAIDRHQ